MTGVPMVVALHDARPGPRLEVVDERSRADAAVLADLFDHYDIALRLARSREQKDPEDDPTGAHEVIEALAMLGDRHVRVPLDDPPEQEDGS